MCDFLIAVSQFAKNFVFMLAQERRSADFAWCPAKLDRHSDGAKFTGHWVLKFHENLVVQHLWVTLDIGKIIYRGGPDIRSHEDVHKFGGCFLNESLLKFSLHLIPVCSDVSRIVSFEPLHSHQS